MEDLKAQLVELLRQAPSGLSNEQLESHFGVGKMASIAGVVNVLLEQKRLNLFQTASGGLLYKYVAEETALKFEGLTQEQMLVYQICEKAGGKGVWTRDIKNQSNIPQHTLNKTLKELELRLLIKYVRSVTSKSRKLYMLFDTTPAKEITGGPWYTDQEFDHAFVEELCKAVVNFVAAASSRCVLVCFSLSLSLSLSRARAHPPAFLLHLTPPSPCYAGPASPCSTRRTCCNNS
jgi:DNA-directed RNA polymerase III subunit RPC6